VREMYRLLRSYSSSARCPGLYCGRAVDGRRSDTNAPVFVVSLLHPAFNHLISLSAPSVVEQSTGVSGARRLVPVTNKTATLYVLIRLTLNAASATTTLHMPPYAVLGKRQCAATGMRVMSQPGKIPRPRRPERSHGRTVPGNIRFADLESVDGVLPQLTFVDPCPPIQKDSDIITSANKD
jgi:hypothetical protein